MAERSPRHRFELTRLEIGGVIVSAAATLFVVFLLGVYAGRGLDGGDLGGEQLVRAPVVTATGAEKDSGALTFDDTLADRPDDGGERLRKELAAEKAKAAAEQRGSVASQDAAPSRDTAAAPAPAAEAARVAVAKADAPPGERADAPAEKRDGASAHDERPAAAAPSPTPKARIAVALASVAPPAVPATRGEWSVQVTATRDPRTADEMVKRLKARGYQAYVQRVQRREGTMYRVRVGRYPTMEAANQLVSRLRREPGVPEAFVASD